jgi:hypothetical protein
MDQACFGLKDHMVEYLRSMTDATQLEEECVVTLPINTFDNRWVDVSVRERAPGFFVVSDSGKAWDELFVQGISLTENVAAKFATIASRFGIHFDNGRFEVATKQELLQHSIWTVGQCSSLAMSELISHKPVAEEDPKRDIGGVISNWGSRFGFVTQTNIKVRGLTADHTFDFVATDMSTHIAVNLLAPSSGGLGSAERYGFQSLDLKDTSEGRWRKMAILSRPERWSAEARNLIKKHADKVIDFQNIQSSRSPIITSLDDLRKVA